MAVATHGLDTESRRFFCHTSVTQRQKIEIPIREHIFQA
jgi:hypothetical protein